MKAAFDKLPASQDDDDLDSYEMYRQAIEPPPSESVETLPRVKTSHVAWQYAPGLAIVLLIIIPPVLLTQLNASFLLKGRSSDEYWSDEQIPCDLSPAWTSWSSLFEVNARTSKISFTAAKLIDVTWDFVVGQGGRAFLAWVAYKVYSDALLRITERDPMSYDLFASIAFSNTLETLIAIPKSLWTARSLRVKAGLMWILISILYVLGFPTLLSASTSYVGATTRAVRLSDNSTVPVSDFASSLSYSIHFHNGTATWDIPIIYISEIYDPCKIMKLADRPYSPLHSLATTVTVNRTEVDVGNDYFLTCGFNFDGHQYRLSGNPEASSSNHVLSYIPPELILCQPDGKLYQWGFSFQMLLLVAIAQVLWSLGLYLMWLDARRNSYLTSSGRKLGRWRAVLDLAEPLKESLGDGVVVHGNQQLEELIKRRRPIMYSSGGPYPTSRVTLSETSGSLISEHNAHSGREAIREV